MRIHKYIVIFFVLFSYCYLDTVAAPLMLEGEDIEVYANRKKKEPADSTNNKKKKELGKITNFIYNTIRITPRNPAAEQRYSNGKTIMSPTIRDEQSVKSIYTKTTSLRIVTSGLIEL